jgi:Rps23 Pro-64 3,4-dihydroxylase Tpa1-like proline 4-hydroxylase
MIHYVDNFLPQDQFEALKKRVDKRFGTGRGHDLQPDTDEPCRVTWHDSSGDWEGSLNFFGHECRPAIEKMIMSLEQDMGAKDLKNWSVWFQYIISSMTLPAHKDASLRKSNEEHTYTAILYTSDWQPGWGGEFIVGEPVWNPDVSAKAVGLKNLTHTIDPLPNRMLIWSRDEWHAVQKVTHPDPNFVRGFFATGWSSVDDFEYFKGDAR